MIESALMSAFTKEGLNAAFKETVFPDFLKNVETSIIKSFDKADLPISELKEKVSEEINKKWLPYSNGIWTGERGDSLWIPEDDYIPIKVNSDNLTWRELKIKYDFKGVFFVNDEPDFSEISKGTVKIENFTDDRNKNFIQADEKLAKDRNITPDEIKKWREQNNYTWHERSDCNTMDLVPNPVHLNVSHSGGISSYKNNLN